MKSHGLVDTFSIRIKDNVKEICSFDSFAEFVYPQ